MVLKRLFSLENLNFYCFHCSSFVTYRSYFLIFPCEQYSIVWSNFTFSVAWQCHRISYPSNYNLIFLRSEFLKGRWVGTSLTRAEFYTGNLQLIFRYLCYVLYYKIILWRFVDSSHYSGFLVLSFCLVEVTRIRWTGIDCTKYWINTVRCQSAKMDTLKLFCDRFIAQILNFSSLVWILIWFVSGVTNIKVEKHFRYKN